MADKIIRDASLTAVADAIRAKVGTSNSLSFPTDFVSALNSIPAASDLFQVKTGLITIGSETATLSITGLGFTPVGFVLALRSYASTSRSNDISTFCYPPIDNNYGIYIFYSSVTEGYHTPTVTLSNGSISVSLGRGYWKDTYFYMAWGA